MGTGVCVALPGADAVLDLGLVINDSKNYLKGMQNEIFGCFYFVFCCFQRTVMCIVPGNVHTPPPPLLQKGLESPGRVGEGGLKEQTIKEMCGI